MEVRTNNGGPWARGLNLAWVLTHADTVKNVIAEVLSEETQMDFVEFKSKVQEAISIAYDILREPLAQAGFELQQSRSIVDPAKKDRILKRLERIAETIEYTLDRY